MRVRYLQSMGVPKGPPIVKGDEATVGEQEGERLVAKQLAERIDQPSRGGRRKAATTTTEDASPSE